MSLRKSKLFFFLLECQRWPKVCQILDENRQQLCMKCWVFCTNDPEKHIFWNSDHHPPISLLNTPYKLTKDSCKREATNRLQIVVTRNIIVHSISSCHLSSCYAQPEIIIRSGAKALIILMVLTFVGQKRYEKSTITIDIIDVHPR